jgi:hypothetical protein
MKNQKKNEINKGQPGHIVAVVPETSTHTSKCSNAIVNVPLQSQAGRNNKKYSASNVWWEDKTRFKKFGFWLWKI